MKSHLQHFLGVTGCIGLRNDDWGLEILHKTCMDLTTFEIYINVVKF